ncbi:MAG: exonuclease SbcCD subunit D [Actinomycetota bacterium]|nr:exonuclease SbcCD subunit D [Actinomycetota bacterium]
MRIIHTSDWHLGRSFHGAGLLDAQAQYLDHLVHLVREEKVDAVLVSGDIYDRALPAPATVALLDDAVVRLLDAGAQVVLSSGNHDSAIRLGFASRVLERAGLHIRTRVDSIGTPVDLGGLVVYPLPYLEPAVVGPELGTDELTHAAVLRAAMQRVRADIAVRNRRSVVMAHAFVTGATTSDSERDIAVGGVAAVPKEVFTGVDYVALGHIHRPMGLAAGIRYSGSPVAMSFSETGQVKSSVVVDFDGPAVRTQLIEAPVHRPLARLRGTLPELLRDPSLVQHESSWCEVTLTDAARPAAAMEQIRRRFPHTLTLGFEQVHTPTARRSYTDRVRGRGDVDLCCDFTQHVRGGLVTSAQEQAIWISALEHARTDRAATTDEGVAVAPSSTRGAA